MARKRVMSDVLRLFRYFTGEEFYPNPKMVSQSIVMSRIVEAFDRVIKTQADQRHKQFRAVLEEADELATELVPDALALFLELQQLLYIARPAIITARRTSWPATSRPGKRLMVFATGGKKGGGSGFANLVRHSREVPTEVDADFVAVVSNHHCGGVRDHAESFGVPFIYYDPDTMGEQWYYQLYWLLGADFVALSGWLKFVVDLPSGVTFNIHPGDERKFGGKGLHGDHVHQAVMAAYAAGEVKQSFVSMFFATDRKYDDSSYTFFRKPVPILPDDTPETLQKRVNVNEHLDQPRITNLVVTGQIRLEPSGDGLKLVVPDWYLDDPGCPEELRTAAIASV